MSTPRRRKPDEITDLQTDIVTAAVLVERLEEEEEDRKQAALDAGYRLTVARVDLRSKVRELVRASRRA